MCEYTVGFLHERLEQFALCFESASKLDPTEKKGGEISWSASVTAFWTGLLMCSDRSSELLWQPRHGLQKAL